MYAEGNLVFEKSVDTIRCTIMTCVVVDKFNTKYYFHIMDIVSFINKYNSMYIYNFFAIPHTLLWCNGYHVRLQCERSQVRSRAEPIFFLIFMRYPTKRFL